MPDTTDGTAGLSDIVVFKEVQFYDIATGVRGTTTGGVHVGLARSRGFEYSSGTVGATSSNLASVYKHYLFDEIQDVARAYGAVCTPDPYVFDKQHRLVYHGRINNAMSPEDKANKNDLRDVLDKLIIGKEILNWFEPSMGCSIKWRSK